MLRSCLLQFCFFCAAFSLHAQVMNAGFEEWDSATVSTTQQVLVPRNWFCYNVPMVDVSMQPLVTRTSEAHSGNYAIRIESGEDDGGVVAGLISSGATFTGTLTANNCGERFPLTGKIGSYSAWYKYLPTTATDSFIVMLLFYRKGSFYGRAYYTGGATSEYTQFNWVLTYPDNVPPADSAKFVVFASPFKGSTGSALYLDDIEVQYRSAPTAIATVNQSGDDIQLVPNPASASFYVTGLLGEGASYRIMDVTGKVVQEGLMNEEAVFIEYLKPGLYSVECRRTLGGPIIRRLQKQN